LQDLNYRWMLPPIFFLAYKEYNMDRNHIGGCMFNRGRKVSRILGRQNDRDAVEMIYNILAPIYAKKPSKLREEEQAFYFLASFIEAMKKGGFKAFYLSEHGNLAVDVSNSMSRIDYDQGYDYLYDSMQVFSGMISKEAMVRKLYYDANETLCNEKWADLDKIFDTVEKVMIKKMIDYVRENILEFR